MLLLSALFTLPPSPSASPLCCSGRSVHSGRGHACPRGIRIHGQGPQVIFGNHTCEMEGRGEVYLWASHMWGGRKGEMYLWASHMWGGRKGGSLFVGWQSNVKALFDVLKSWNWNAWTLRQLYSLSSNVVVMCIMLIQVVMCIMLIQVVMCIMNIHIPPPCSPPLAVCPPPFNIFT
jgi:hypothetical protein